MLDVGCWMFPKAPPLPLPSPPFSMEERESPLRPRDDPPCLRQPTTCAAVRGSSGWDIALRCPLVRKSHRRSSPFELTSTKLNSKSHMKTQLISPPPDLQTIKAKQKATWESGDFGQIARVIENVAVDFMARLPLKTGQRVLDVACGTGNLAVIAARRG